MADAREGVDKSFHLVEHAIDDHRKFGEGIVRVVMREPFAQVAGDDALHPFVDLHDALSGTSAQHHADRNAKKHRGNEPECERRTNDACDLLDFIGISSDHQQVAIGQTSRDQADRLLLSAASVDPADHGVLCRAVYLETGWLAFHVACDPVAI